VPDTDNLKTGELALNMADEVMYSSDGNKIFEIGSRNTDINVSNTATIKAISANGSLGTPGQVLVTDGNAIYWGDVTPQFRFINQLFIADGKTARYTVPGGYTPGSMNVYEDGIKVSIDELDDSDGSTILFKAIPKAGVEVEYCGMKIGIQVLVTQPEPVVKLKKPRVPRATAKKPPTKTKTINKKK
jgi:hypothetical protein